MYDFLVGWYVGAAIGRPLGYLIACVLVLTLFWFATPFLLAWLVNDRVVRPWLRNRKSRKLQGMTYV